jgi:hypothetical protein
VVAVHRIGYWCEENRLARRAGFGNLCGSLNTLPLPPKLIALNGHQGKAIGDMHNSPTDQSAICAFCLASSTVRQQDQLRES